MANLDFEEKLLRVAMSIFVVFLACLVGISIVGLIKLIQYSF